MCESCRRFAVTVFVITTVGMPAVAQTPSGGFRDFHFRLSDTTTRGHQPKPPRRFDDIDGPPSLTRFTLASDSQPDYDLDMSMPTLTAAESAPATGPLPTFGETLRRDLADLPAQLWSDTKKVYGSPTNLLILGLTYGGALAVQETGPDDTVERSYRSHRTFDKDWRDAFGALGNPGTHLALAGGWWLAGQQTQDHKTYDVGRKLFSALIITDLSTLLGQAATWDESPNGEWGTFPSGHTSSTFAFASVMHQEYGPLVGAPLYGLGALVAMERLEDGEHYLSDVLFGGVLGLVVGHTVASDKPLEIFGGRIVPYADPNTQTTGIAWWKQIE